MSSYHWDRYTASESFERIKRGEYPWVAFGDFLDDWYRSRSEDRCDLITQPLAEAATAEEQRWATLFAGAIEELCQMDSIPMPIWIMESRYYLAEPWYPTARKEALRRFMEETTPQTFKQRKVFVGDRALLRA